MTLFRKLLYSLMIVGGLASTISAGTYASFNAATEQSASFQSGTLVLDRMVGATSCFSVGGTGAPGNTNTDTNANGSCDATISVNRLRIGQSTYVDLTLTNAGTLGGTLSFGAPVACTSDNNPGATWSGGGDMCINTAWTLQEWTSGFGSELGSCAYPVNGGSSCSLTAPATLTPNPSPPSPITSATPGLPLIGSPQAVGTLESGASRYFRLTFQLPTGVDNQLQGMRAQFKLTWQLGS